MSTNIKYNYVEVTQLDRQIEQWLLQIEAAETVLKQKRSYLTRLRDNNDKGNQSWILAVPKDFFEGFDSIDIRPFARTEKIKWKEEVLQLIVSYDMPMDTVVAYNKLMQRYPCMNASSIAISKNITAALASLYHEEKLVRFALRGKRYYLYGLTKFADNTTGRIRNDYREKFEFENQKLQ